MPAKKHKERGQRCIVCQRIFYPKIKSDTCLICQSILNAEKKTTDKQPNFFESEALEIVPKKPGKHNCNRCGEEFNSQDVKNNCICPKCAKTNAKVSILATPSSQGKLSS